MVDVGCGTGSFLRRLVDQGVVAVGVEPSAGMRDAASRKVPDARILDGHLAVIPLADASVDAAIATYVVSHLSAPEQPAAIDELLRVVDGPGPLVLVDVPRVAPGDLPRVRDVLRAAGRADQIPWYEDGYGLDVETWQGAFERSGRRVLRESLGPVLIGLAGLPARVPCG